MKLKDELKGYQHTNRVQAEYIGELKEEVRLLQKALDAIEFLLKKNAEGKQPYGGFHTPTEEFQYIYGIARKSREALEEKGERE